MPESLPLAKRATTRLTFADANPIRKISEALSRDSIRPILLAIFVVNVAFSALQSNFALFTLKRFQMGPQDNAWIFVYIGSLSILMQGVVVRKMPKTLNPVATCVTGLSAMSLGFLGISFAQVEWHLFPAIAILAFGNGIAAPMLTGLISRRVGEREQGSVLGSSQAILSSTRIVGPLFAGFVFDALGSGAPYWTGAILAIAGAAIVARTPAEA